MFALGLVSWMFGRPIDGSVAFLGKKFASAPDIRDGNIAALRTGYNYGETTESFAVSYVVKPAVIPAGRYRNITGNTALAVRDRGRRSALWATGLPRRLPDHSRLRSAARAVQAQGVRCHHVPGRGRDRRRWRRSGCELWRRAGSHHDVRAGARAQGRDDRPRGHARSPLGGGRRSARRAVHGVAHQDRTVRSATGHERSQRRSRRRSSRRSHPPTASTPRSRPPGSR